MSQRFDPFGGLLQRSSAGGPRSAYGFAGEEQDPTSGQLFLRARTYNPATGRFLQSDPVMGSPADPRTLHHYAYAFNNPINYTDSSGLWVGTLQQPREQRQNSSFQNLTNNYSSQSGTQLGYAGPAGRGGFNQAYMGQPGQASGIGAQRAATGPEARNWQPHSDSQPREQSQGKRPKPCGFTDILFGLGNSALNGNLLNDAFELSMHSPPALRQWMAQHATLLKIMAGAVIIGGALVLTGGAALVPILLGAGIGAGIGYGSQVWNNWQRDGTFNLPTLGERLGSFRQSLTHVNWGAVGWAAFHGAVAGAAAEIIAPLLPSGGVGVTGMLESAFANVISGRVSQVALNVMDGQAWDKDLDNLHDIALDVLVGVAVGAYHTGQAGKAAAKAAEAETATKAARALDEGVEESRFASSVDEVADNPLQRLDDLMSDRPASNMSKEELREALAGNSESGALSRRLAKCNSFTAGTPVETETGQKPIEEIKVGDKVLAEDPATGEQGYFEVVALTNHPTDEVLRVTLDAEQGSENLSTSLDIDAESGNNGNDVQLNTRTDDDQPTQRLADQPATMNVTPDHPVYVEGKGWLWAENLTLGDRLRRADGGMAKVLAVERVKLAEPELVYNFTVKGPHTYFVLEVGVLVHNASCGPDVTGPATDADARLAHLDDFTGGNTPTRQFGRSPSSDALSRRLGGKSASGNLDDLRKQLEDARYAQFAQFRDSVLSLEKLPGFTVEESRYIRDALNNDVRNIQSDIVCFDSARCLETTTTFRDDLRLARETGQFISKLDSSTFKMVGELEDTIHLHQLEPGDFLIYYWKKNIGTDPVHANRFLGFAEEGTPLFFDKWGDYPFNIRSLGEVQVEGKNDLGPILVFRR